MLNVLLYPALLSPSVSRELLGLVSEEATGEIALPLEGCTAIVRSSPASLITAPGSLSATLHCCRWSGCSKNRRRSSSDDRYDESRSLLGRNRELWLRWRRMIHYIRV